VPATPTVRFGQAKRCCKGGMAVAKINENLIPCITKSFQETLSVPLVSHHGLVTEASPGAAAALRNIAHL